MIWCGVRVQCPRRGTTQSWPSANYEKKTWPQADRKLQATAFESPLCITLIFRQIQTSSPPDCLGREHADNVYPDITSQNSVNWFSHTPPATAKFINKTERKDRRKTEQDTGNTLKSTNHVKWLGIDYGKGGWRGTTGKCPAFLSRDMDITGIIY